MYPQRGYKHPDELDVLPRADAIIVFSATFNTLNKWAFGISDTLAGGWPRRLDWHLTQGSGIT